jgi:phospholipid transport system substrate-binding protein
MRRAILFFVLNIITANVYAINAYPEVKQYVDQLVTEASNVLNDTTLTESVKLTKSSALISANLDLDWMAKYTLGRHKKELSESQINAFTHIYSQYVTKTYSDLVKNYKGERAKIKKVYSLNNNEEFIVNTEIIKNYGQPALKVDYLVRKVAKNADNNFKISDVITEGVSMVNSQQAEFNSIILNSGFDSLITNLKKKL